MIVTYLSEKLDTDIVAVRLTMSLLLGYPVAIFYSLVIKNMPRVVHNIYFLTFGLLLYYWNFSYHVTHPLAAILVNYFLLQIFGGTKFTVTFAFIFNTSHLMIGYYLKNLGDYDINWTTPHCVLTLRLIGLVWDVYDSSRPPDELSSTQKKNAIKELPDLLEVMAFSFTPTAFLVGPQFSLAHYQAMITNTLQPEVAKDKKSFLVSHKFGLSIEDRKQFTRGVSRLIGGVVYIAIYVGLTFIVNLETFYSDAFLKDWTFLQRIVYMCIFGKLTLMRYIGVWLISEGACVMTGLGCTGRLNEDGTEPSHDACANVHIREYELAVNCNHLVSSFNSNTNKWMLEYVYKRLKFVNNKHVSQIVTLFYLAMWHGSYSGYYINFLLEYLTVGVERDLLGLIARSSWSAPLASPIGVIFCKVFGKIFIFFILGQPLTAFCLLRFKDWFKVLSTVYFSGFIFVLWPLVRPLFKLMIGCRSHPPPPEKTK